MTSGRSRAAFSHDSMGGRGVPGFTARWCRHWNKGLGWERNSGWISASRQEGWKIFFFCYWAEYDTTVSFTTLPSASTWNLKHKLDCSTWKCLWKAGLGMWWTSNMSFCSAFSSSSSSTNIMESMRESTADSWVSNGVTHTKVQLSLFFHLSNVFFSLIKYTQCQWREPTRTVMWLCQPVSRLINIHINQSKNVDMSTTTTCHAPCFHVIFTPKYLNSVVIMIKPLVQNLFNKNVLACELVLWGVLYLKKTFNALEMQRQYLTAWTFCCFQEREM